MPRIRYIKPDFFSDEDLGRLPFQTRLTFAGLWCYADKAGRLEDRPEFLKAMIFPYDDVDMNHELDRLAEPKRRTRNPFIVRYEVDGIHLIQILTFNKHQKPHHTEKVSTLQEVPEIIMQQFLTVKQPLNNRSLTGGNGDGNGDGDGDGKGKGKIIAPSDFHRSEPETEELYVSRVKKEVPESLDKNRELWAKAYPAVDLDQECSKALAWLISHPKNKKQMINKFLNGWLTRAQENAPSKGASGGMTRSPTEKEKIFIPCPECGKETTKADLDKFGSCPACFKPLTPEKMKGLAHLMGKIGEETK
jgi:hypothetical protein